MQKELLVQNFLLNGDKNEIEQAKLYFGEQNVIVSESFEKFPHIAIERLRRVLYQFSKQISRNGE